MNSNPEEFNSGSTNVIIIISYISSIEEVITTLRTVLPVIVTICKSAGIFDKIHGIVDFQGIVKLYPVYNLLGILNFASHIKCVAYDYLPGVILAPIK